MALSAKHFKAIAHVLVNQDAHAEVRDQSNDGPADREQRRVGSIAHELARIFAQDNPRFDKDRFLRAALTADNPFHPDHN